jgi:hypothetical protein
MPSGLPAESSLDGVDPNVNEGLGILTVSMFTAAFEAG